VPTSPPLPPDNSRFVLSFTEAGTIPGVGSVDDSDLVLFTPTAIGESTAGTFSMFFDGSDIGLTRSDEDVDAVEFDGYGGNMDLYLSTTGSFTADSLSGEDEDIFLCRPADVGDDSSACGTLTLAFDGSTAGLGGSGEDIDALTLTVGSSANMLELEPPAHFSTTDDYTTPTAEGEDNDLFSCDFPTTLADCGGPLAPLLTTLIADTYDLDEDITALAMENRQIEEP
jgi:hypothetical protein